LSSRAHRWAVAHAFHANEARRQIGKQLKNLRSTNTSADHHRAIRIDAVNLKHRLRNIDPDCDSLAHGRTRSGSLVGAIVGATALATAGVRRRVKIDRSFVQDVTNREDSIAIVRAVAGLGKSLGISTTAEGVETRDQLQLLRAEGCTEVQGYLFSPPRPSHDVECLLGNQHLRIVA
jgi:hypothetical protein